MPDDAQLLAAAFARAVGRRPVAGQVRVADATLAIMHLQTVRLRLCQHGIQRLARSGAVRRTGRLVRLALRAVDGNQVCQVGPHLLPLVFRKCPCL
jgi:hypothetical protein